MSNLIRKYGVSLALVAAFATMAVTLGNTLTVIQNRQANEIKAIHCLLDSRCSAAAMHGHAHLPTRHVVQPATTTLV